MVRSTLLLVLLLAAGLAPVQAQDQVFSLEMPSGVPVQYRVPLQIVEPGELVAELGWEGGRILTLRLVDVDGNTAMQRRSGPSPQQFRVMVIPGAWELQIRGLAQRQGTRGTLTITLPSEAPREEPQPVRSPPQPEPPRRPELSPIPAGSPSTWHRFSREVKAFRESIETDPEVDSCRWQADLLDYLEQRHEALVSRSKVPATSTMDALASISGAIDTVEAMRTSDDPVLAGPVPKESRKRKAWSRDRHDRVVGIELELDNVREDLHRGYAAELDDETWPARLMACLTACERHFEERVRLGEERATNGSLTRAQWERLLAAGRALSGLAAVDDDR